MTPFLIHDAQSKARVLSFIDGLSLDRQWDVEVKRHTKRRSLSQNALMWTWINRAAEVFGNHYGWDATDVHEYFKQKFCPPVVREIDGETVEIRSTKKLSIEQMTRYLNDIHRHCAQEHGINLPLPEEMYAR
ncbi:MAG: recombination protein NinB [Pseudomonadota bacterium]|nr:recombination protein NinB [Pseudomonadota bacterium]